MLSFGSSSIQGLEGRSNYPVALLLDALQKPEADLGLKNPSLLEWRHRPEKTVDHVVLGRGGPGGIWQSINGDMLTVSLGRVGNRVIVIIMQ